jgi:hypothetical protein
MAITCPLMYLPCETTSAEVDTFEHFGNTARLYFNASQTLDYFNFFLDRGTHIPTPAGEVNDPERGNCDWKVNGRSYEWPMTRVDCAIGYDAIGARAAAIDLTGASFPHLGDLQNAIRSYHDNSSVKNKAEALLYALSILSGNGTVAAGPSIIGCDFPHGSLGGTGSDIKFGAYF